MPAVGLEYRYPFIGVQPWGTQTIEPIAQLIVRPNEPAIGKLPNEDAQSLIFDDSNLFSVNKFSGWDRIEGGARLNAGMQYTAQFNRAGFVNAMFGQSYQLFGQNSFAAPGHGQYRPRQRARVARDPTMWRASPTSPTTSIRSSRASCSQKETFDVRRVEVEAKATFDRWQFTGLYGNYEAQPEIGFLERRHGRDREGRSR